MIPSHRPSLQGRFSLIWSGDSALQPRPEDPQAAAEYDHALDVCRETGDWKPLLKDGDTPTVFRFELPTGTKKRHLLDLVGRLHDESPHALSALFFRATVREVTGLGDYKVKLVRDDDTGLDLVRDDLVSILDAESEGIVLELAAIAIKRFLGTPGK